MRLQINFWLLQLENNLWKICCFIVAFSIKNWVMFKKKACHPIKKLGQIDRHIPCRLQWFVVAKSCGSGTSIDILLILNYPMGETGIPIWKKSLRKWTFKNSAQISTLNFHANKYQTLFPYLSSITRLKMYFSPDHSSFKWQN